MSLHGSKVANPGDPFARFNQVRLPAGTVIDGRDAGGYEFSPPFVDASRFKERKWHDIPFLAEREVWLKRSVLDPEGRPVTDVDGKCMKDVVKVMPQEIKDALADRGTLPGTPPR